jgi:O-succinylbenzoic acid--CoA ligase
MKPFLQIDHTKYSFSDLLEIENPITYADKTIWFCRQWKQGKSPFEIQTSGSTGTPKKILLSRESMIYSALATANALGLQAGQTSLVCLDTSYIAGMMMLVRSMEIGMNVVAIKPSNNPFENIEPDAKIDFAAMVPYQLVSVLESSQQNFLNRIKNILIGGAPLDLETKKKSQNFSCNFYETYGMTETISHIALKKLNGISQSEYFHVFPGITIRQDERGCLCIKAPYLTEEVITNDVVKFKNQEEFLWLGRWDNVINTGGVKVFPEKTEERIATLFNQLEIKNRFLVTGLPDERLGQAVTLLIEGKLIPEQELLLRENLKQLLYKYEAPRSIKLVAEFAQTENGKINRNQTILLYQNQQI